MAKYLIDTIILLWWLRDEEKLSKKVREILASPENPIYLSVVSGWEIIIKKKKRTDFRFEPKLSEVYDKTGFSVLPINLSHVLEIENLPLHHADSFDRMLTAQAVSEDLTVITADKKITKYPVKTLLN